MVKLDKVKWGFIGCGEVTEKKSGPAFALIEGSEVVAVMSRDKEKAQSYAKRHNIPRWYSDPQQLIGQFAGNNRTGTGQAEKGKSRTNDT